MTATTWPHVELNADKVPMIAGTTTKVVEVVLDHLAHHWDAHEIRRQYPSAANGRNQKVAVRRKPPGTSLRDRTACAVPL